MVIATMTGDNSDTTLDLGVTPVSENNVQVYIDGTYQNKSTYSISGQTLTFSTAPPTGTAVEAITHTVLDISAAASSVLIDEFTGNGSTTAFTLAAAPANENNTQVYVGGVYQEKATYSVSGTTLTLTEAPANGVSVEVMSIAVGQINSAIQLSDADGDTKVMVEESSDEDKIRFDTGGTERMIIDGASVGIGTSSPGDMNASANNLVVGSGASSDNTGITIFSNSNSSGSIHFADGTSGAAAYAGDVFYNHSNDYMGFLTGGTERFRISGNNLFLNGGTDARIQLGSGGAGANQVDNNTVHIRGDGTSMKLMAASGGSHVFEINGTSIFQLGSSTILINGGNRQTYSDYVRTYSGSESITWSSSTSANTWTSSYYLTYQIFIEAALHFGYSGNGAISQHFKISMMNHYSGLSIQTLHSASGGSGSSYHTISFTSGGAYNTRTLKVVNTPAGGQNTANLSGTIYYGMAI
jgi:hypothetical protein